MDEWGLLGCGWGDTIVSMSNAKKKNIRKIIYVGSFPEIVDFLKAQDFIDEVEHVPYSPKDDGYWLFFFHLSIRKDPDKVLADFIESRKLGNHRKYVNLQLNFGGGDELELFEDFNFSQRAIKEANKIEKEYKLKDFILFQPVSLHSTPAENFYPYWDIIFKKTVEMYPDNQIVLIGQTNSKIEVKHDHFIDLRNKFSTAESIGYLLRKAKLVITLPNNSIYFCNKFKTPTISFCNREFEPALAFRRTMNKNTMILVDWKAPYDEAKHVLENWENIIENNQFRMENHVDFIGKFYTLTVMHLKETLKTDYYQQLHVIFDKYQDEDWYFGSGVPVQVAAFSHYFNKGKGVSQGSYSIEKYHEAYEALNSKTTMIRKSGIVSKKPIVFLSDESFLTSKVFRDNFNHFVCISHGNNDRLRSFIERNNFQYEEYNKYIIEVRK
jgi:hypothetical protein